MGYVKQIAIAIDEHFSQEDFDRLETLTEADFAKDPAVVTCAGVLGISVDFLSGHFMHNVE